MKQFAISENQQARIEALVNTLDRTLSGLAIDIKTEEARSGMADVASPAYPILARHLQTRYANLAATITELRSRLLRQVERDRLAC